MMAPVDGSGSWPACRQIVLKRAFGVSFTIRYDTCFNIAKSTPMARSRSQRPLPAAPDRQTGLRHALLHTLPGRAIVVGLAIKLAVLALGAALGGVPAFFGVVDTVAALAVAGGAAYFLVPAVRAGEAPAAVARAAQADPLLHLHRVRAGDPLIVVFFLLCGFLLFYNFSSYLVQSRLRALSDEARFLAQSTALEIQRAGGRDVAAIVAARQANASQEFPGISLAVVPVGRPCADRQRGRRRCRRRVADTAGAVGARRPAARDSVVDRLRRLRRPAGVHRIRPRRPGSKRTCSCAPPRFPIRRGPATPSSSTCR